MSPEFWGRWWLLGVVWDRGGGESPRADFLQRGLLGAGGFRVGILGEFFPFLCFLRLGWVFFIIFNSWLFSSFSCIWDLGAFFFLFFFRF